MRDFDHILNWRLLSGTHEFPGPDGGTCINEAAIIAAGLPYRPVISVADLPPCFSLPIAMYALGLNDTMTDEARQGLMRFVTRLSGSRDTPEMELERANYILVMTVRRIVSSTLEAFQQYQAAVAAQQTRNVSDAVRFLGELCDGSYSYRRIARCDQRLSDKLKILTEEAVSFHLTGSPHSYVPGVAVRCAGLATQFQQGNAIAMEILEAVLQMGEQAPSIAVEAVETRLRAARVPVVA